MLQMGSRESNTDITHTHSIFNLKHEAYRRLLFINKSRVFHEEIIFQLLFKFKGFITESFVTARPNVLNLHPHLPPLRLTGAHWNQLSYLLIKSQHMLHFTLFLMNTSISKKFAFVFYFQCFCLSWYTLIFKVHIKFKCPIPLSIFSLMVMWCMMVYPLILYHLGHNPCVLQ